MTSRDPVTGTGGEARQFPATSWTLLKQARAATPEERARALQPFLELYWKPVYCLVRQAWRKPNEESKDLTQDFFARVVLEGGLLAKYDRSRGGFRGFLKAAVLNFLRDDARAAGAQKRGGASALLPLPESGEDLPLDASLTPEQAFDETWRAGVLDRALGLLKRRLVEAGKARAYEAFVRYDLEPPAEGISYPDLAAELGVSRDTLKDWLKLARSGYRAAVIDVVAEGVETEEDLLGEVDDLLG